MMTELDPASLSDEELLVLRERWNSERPRLWREVVRHKGLDYRREYEAFMAAKTEAERATTELRRRGLIRRGRSPGERSKSSSGTATERNFRSTFTCDQSAQRLVVRADGHVRLGEKDRTALHAAVRAGVARLHLGDGEILRAAFHGSKPTVRTDIENLVLYNIALNSECLRSGVAFEYLSSPPGGWDLEYTYEAVPADNPTRYWVPGRRLITWPEVSLRTLSAAAVWWTLQPTGQPQAAADGDQEVLFACRLATNRTVGVTEVKAVGDGCLAAAQSMPHPEPSRCELVANALQRTLSIKPPMSAIKSALGDSERSVLGPCSELIRWDGGVNPDDHRLVAGVILIEPSADTELRLVEASIFTAARSFNSTEGQPDRWR